MSVLNTLELLNNELNKVTETFWNKVNTKCKTVSDFEKEIKDVKNAIEQIEKLENDNQMLCITLLHLKAVLNGLKYKKAELELKEKLLKAEKSTSH